MDNIKPSAEFDLVVIGAGPGGYVCAIRAAQLGLKVACVEKRATLGGTCLNVGCIPSKALLQSSENYSAIVHNFADHGLIVPEVTIDLDRMHARKREVVAANVSGAEFLFKKNKVAWLKGEAKLLGGGQLAVGDNVYAAKSIVIATGSDSASLPGIEADGVQIITSTEALELNPVPGRFVVIGGGVIGLELGSVWRRLGADVTVVEYTDRIAGGVDGEIARALERALVKQGIKFKLKTKVISANIVPEGVDVATEPADGGPSESLIADRVMLAVGRRPYTAGLGLKDAGIDVDRMGRIPVNASFETAVRGIYAIGDVIAGPMLAHKAEDEGVAVAELLSGQAGHVNYEAIPSVIYTWPEVASVGKSEDELKTQGIAFNVGKFPFMANGRARAMGETDGFVKILADAKTDRLLGAHIIGPDAGTLIAELVTAIEFGASSEDVARICHAHPTLNEAVKEAALAVDRRALHI